MSSVPAQTVGLCTVRLAAPQRAFRPPSHSCLCSPQPYVRRATRVPPVSRRAVVVIAVVLGLVVLLSGVVAWEVRNKRRHMDLLGRVKPPMGDPDTTIVVASMQASTISSLCLTTHVQVRQSLACRSARLVPLVGCPLL